MNKYEYACTAAVSLAYLLLRQQDAVGCLAFDEAVRATVPNAHQAQPLEFDHSVALREPAAEEDRLAANSPQGGRELSAPRHDDFDLRSAGRAAGFIKGIKLLRQRGHDVMVLHIMDDDELDFPFSGPTRFDGLELPEHLTCNPRALREGYLEALNAYLEEIRRACSQNEVRLQTGAHQRAAGCSAGAFHQQSHWECRGERNEARDADRGSAAICAGC